MVANIPNLLPNFADLLLDAVFLVDVHGRVVYVNAACERIFGYTQAELIGRTLIDLVAPEDRARTWEEAIQVMSGRPRIGFENRYIHKDGHQVHIMWSARWSESDQLRIGVARDVTERKHAEEMQAATYAIAEAAHHAVDLTSLFREIHQIISKLVPVAAFIVATREPGTEHLTFPYQIDMHGNSATVQDPIARRFCVDAIQSEKPSQAAAKAFAPDDPSAASDGDAVWLAMPFITQDKAIGAVAMRSYPGTTYSEKDMALLQYVCAQAATAIERKRLHAELLRAARYDELTGLPNRRLFSDRAQLVLSRCRRKQARFALLYLDIDNFKQVNDTLGHEAGDLLLQEVARRLSHCIRAEDTVARLGGDEFVMLLEDIHSATDAASVASKIRQAVQTPIHLTGQALYTVASIGIAVYPEDGVETSHLLRHADKEMYRDKMARKRL
ncbi:MAG TPA: diguanylate cyclase [Burkholderiaceae bacterium]|nr:diguanylate cyclase [Burkholderiaceae bacterium]